ncbi:MAG: crossover junction endodeoxyribonuclease RuvC [Anaerolineaceae bacterium]|nr:crossover junction endodeoxyribonuclease RuvC [Anaerolineaceae bacterium]
MCILGIDPGTATTGFGLIEETQTGLLTLEYGIISTPANMPMDKRLVILYDRLNELILKYHPESCAVERLFFRRNVTTAISVGQARGVILLSLSKNNIPIAEYTPMEIKLAIAGYGAAEKKQVQFMVQSILELKNLPKPDDAADALAIAICHLHSKRIMDLYE